MNEVPETVLHESLDFMEQGESIEQILSRYPEMAQELRPFLETAVQLATLAPQPSLSAKQKSQKAFLDHAASLKVAPVQPSPWYRLRQAILPLASLAIVLILMVTTAFSVSASAIPGDALYPVKRLVENVLLARANDPETAVALREEYRLERIREVQILLRTGRSAEVTFTGVIDMMQADVWIIEDLSVQLDEATIIEGRPQIGEMALVNGRTADGLLTASLIQILTGTALDPEATVTPQPTLEPTNEATEEVTPAPTTVESTEEPTVTSTSTATSRPTATLTSTPAPTATELPFPTPSLPPTNDNGDDNNNDNEEDEGGNTNENGDDDNNNNDGDNSGSGGGDNGNGDDDNDNDDDNSGSGNNNNDNDDDNDNGNGNEDDDD